MLKKHENTEKLTSSQDEKVANLCEFGETLVENGHNEADMITARVKAVCERRNKLKEELEKRRHKLEESKKIAQFYQDVVEVKRETKSVKLNIATVIAAGWGGVEYCVRPEEWLPRRLVNSFSFSFSSKR